VVCCRAKKVTNAMFYAAAKRLASIVPEEDVQAGRVYPDIAKIREVSKQIAIEGTANPRARIVNCTTGPHDLP
jgi:malic enzyme